MKLHFPDSMQWVTSVFILRYFLWKSAKTRTGCFSYLISNFTCGVKIQLSLYYTRCSKNVNLLKPSLLPLKKKLELEQNKEINK